MTKVNKNQTSLHSMLLEKGNLRTWTQICDFKSWLLHKNINIQTFALRKYE